MKRRAFLGGALALAACKRASPSGSSSTDAPSRPDLVRELRFEPTPATPEGEEALLLAPPNASELPLLVALHGRGESGRGLEIGADAWPNNYQMVRVHERLLAPPLTKDDLLGMTTPERLARLNASLAANPYRGLVVACPYTPYAPVPNPIDAEPFARFVIDELIPAAKTMAKIAALPREKTAIDGVSMGGRMALMVGLAHPEVFGVVGAMQPGIKVEEADALADIAKRANEKAPIKLRILSSEDDYFLDAVKALGASLRAKGVPHELVVVAGDHGYEFNRGPGSAELLLGNERALRGLPPP